MTALGVETAGTQPVQQLSNNAIGVTMGQSTTDLISFYNGTPVVQPTNANDVVTCLQNLGLLAPGTYTLKGISSPATQTAGTTAAAIASNGMTSCNSTVAVTLTLSPPVTGVTKFLYEDVATTAVVTINVNSSTVGASAVTLRVPNLATAGASLGNILFGTTTINGGYAVSLRGISATEWLVESANTTGVTYTT